MFRNNADLKNHVEMHDPKNAVTCDLCGRSYPNRAKYLHHVSQAHKNPKETCHICGEMFLWLNQLDAHLVRDHGGERKYICQYCGARFIQNSHHKRHVRQFHTETDNPRIPSRRERSANKKRKVSWKLKIYIRSDPNLQHKVINHKIYNRLLQPVAYMGTFSETVKMRATNLW